MLTALKSLVDIVKGYGGVNRKRNNFNDKYKGHLLLIALAGIAEHAYASIQKEDAISDKIGFNSSELSKTEAIAEPLHIFVESSKTETSLINIIEELKRLDSSLENLNFNVSLSNPTANPLKLEYLLANNGNFKPVSETIKAEDKIQVESEQPVESAADNVSDIEIAENAAVKTAEAESAGAASAASGVFNTILTPLTAILGAAGGLAFALSSSGGASNNKNPSANIKLDNLTVPEAYYGMRIGSLITPASVPSSAFVYTVNDSRFEIINGELKLKDGISLDYNLEQSVDITIKETNLIGQSLSKSFTLTVTDVGETIYITGAAEEDTFDMSVSIDSFRINALAGNDTINTSIENDIVRPGEGIDTVNTGAGNDIIVVVGKTSSNQYNEEASITNPGGSGIDLSDVVTFDTLNNRSVSEAAAGEIIDGGAGNDMLVIYGDVDLTGTTIVNVTELQVNSALTITADQLNSIPFASIYGDGKSVLNISGSGSPITVDLSNIDFDKFHTLNLDDQVTVIADQADVASLKYISGGIIKASDASVPLDLTDKIISSTVQNKDGAEYTGHGAEVLEGSLLLGNVSDNSLTGSDYADRIEGGAGNDILQGGAGEDIIRGGAGVDEMYGGAGNDSFIIVGDITGGGKVDSTLDTKTLGHNLTDLNGINLNEDEDGAAEIIDGGAGEEDTLYVYGSADLSNFTITGIENVEMRSHVIFDESFFRNNNIKTMIGDGSSTLEITGESIALDLTDPDSMGLHGIGHILLGEHVTLKIDAIKDLGGARIISGPGKLETSVDFGDVMENFILSEELQVDGTDISDALVVRKVSSSYTTSDAKYGTDGKDYLMGADGINDNLDGISEDDLLNGEDGDDTYIISGTGTKTIIDSKGNDTIDLSQAQGPAEINLAEGGGTIAKFGNPNEIIATIELGSGKTLVSKRQIDLFLLQDISGSYKNDIDTLKNVIDNTRTGLVQKMQESYPESHFGLGTFENGTLGNSPREYYETNPPDPDKYYETRLSLPPAQEDRNNETDFKDAVDDLEIGRDEELLLSLKTVVERAESKIGYTDHRMKWLLVSTDEKYEEDIQIDFDQLSKDIKAKGIYPVFLVPSVDVSNPDDLIHYYQNFVDNVLGIGDVVKLEEKSENIIEAFKASIENYQEDFIENLIGTDFDDKLTGNSLDNRIEGGDGDDIMEGLGGNDTIIGGAGIGDVAVFSGDIDEYDIAILNDKLIVQDNGEERDGEERDGEERDGTDTVYRSVEQLQFADTKIYTSEYFENKVVQSITDKYPFLILAQFAAAAYDNEAGQAVKEELANDGWNFRAVGCYSEALIATKGDSLVLSFKGTDDWENTNAWINQSNYYSFMENMNNHITNPANDIKKVYVTGHGWGGTMATWYLMDGTYGGSFLAYRDENTEPDKVIEVFGASFGAPEAIGIDPTKSLDPNIDYYRFEVAKDIVPDIVQIVNGSDQTGVEYVMDELGTIPDDAITLINSLLDKSDTYDLTGFNPGKQINLITSYDGENYSEAINLHDMSYYLDGLTLLEETGVFKDLDYARSEKNIVADSSETRYDAISLQIQGNGASNITGDEGGLIKKEFYFAEKYTENDLIVGTGKDDMLRGDGKGSLASTNDLFYPGTGNDTIYGHDAMSDKGGIDVIAYQVKDIGIFDSSSKDVQDVKVIGTGNSYGLLHKGEYVNKLKITFSDLKTDTVSDIEALHFIDEPSEGRDLLAYGDKEDTINAGAGDDLIFGGGGNDTLIGGAGNDRIHGGRGEDIAEFSGLKDDYSFSIENWALKVDGTDGEDYLYGVEQLRFDGDTSYTHTPAGVLNSSLVADLLGLYSPVIGYTGSKNGFAVYGQKNGDYLEYALKVNDAPIGDRSYFRIELDPATLLPIGFMGALNDLVQVRNPWDHELEHINNHPIIWVDDDFMDDSTYLTLESMPKQQDNFTWLIPNYYDIFDKSKGVNGDGSDYDLKGNTIDYRLISDTTTISNEGLEFDFSMGGIEDVYNSRYEADGNGIIGRGMDGMDDGVGIKLAGEGVQGDMELGFLFDDTPLAELGHFDLV